MAAPPSLPLPSSSSAASTARPPPTSRVRLTHAQKLELCEYSAAHTALTLDELAGWAAMHFRLEKPISTTAVSRARRNHDALQQLSPHALAYRTYRKNFSLCAQFETRLRDWIVETAAQGLRLDTNIIQSEAQRLRAELDDGSLSKCSLTKGWLSRFMARHEISLQSFRAGGSIIVPGFQGKPKKRKTTINLVGIWKAWRKHRIAVPAEEASRIEANDRGGRDNRRCYFLKRRRFTPFNFMWFERRGKVVPRINVDAEDTSRTWTCRNTQCLEVVLCWLHSPRLRDATSTRSIWMSCHATVGLRETPPQNNSAGQTQRPHASAAPCVHVVFPAELLVDLGLLSAVKRLLQTKAIVCDSVKLCDENFFGILNPRHLFRPERLALALDSVSCIADAEFFIGGKRELLNRTIDTLERQFQLLVDRPLRRYFMRSVHAEWMASAFIWDQLCLTHIKRIVAALHGCEIHRQEDHIEHFVAIFKSLIDNRRALAAEIEAHKLLVHVLVKEPNERTVGVDARVVAGASAPFVSIHIRRLVRAVAVRQEVEPC